MSQSNESIETTQALQVNILRNPNILTTLKHVAGRAALALCIATGTSVINETINAPTNPAEAATIDNYPWANAADHNPSNYDWWIDENGDGKKQLNGELMDPDEYYYRNCTSYVAWRVKTETGKSASGLGNANTWDDNAPGKGYIVDTTPEPGDAAVWDTTGPGDKYGHVAYVESVNADGSANITDYNFTTRGGPGRRNNVRAHHYVDFNGTGVGANGAAVAASPNTAASPERDWREDGTFVLVNESKAIYRMVGGAPIRIYNQGAVQDFDGGKVRRISHEELGKLSSYPKDGKVISIAEAGGSGLYRFVGGAPVRLFNQGAIKDMPTVITVNEHSLATYDHMLRRPKDGAVISIAEAGGSGIYRFVGGAPIRLYNQGAIKDLPEAVTVNFHSLATYDHMNTRPADGAAISIVEAGGSGIYRFVGGAPIRLFNQGVIPDMPNVVGINSHSLSVYDHMNRRPANGSTINIVEAGGSGIYEFVGGAPLRLFNWGAIPGFKPPVNVNFQSLASSDHMNARPTNGEFIASVETGRVYRTAGGAALKLYNHGAIPGYGNVVFVNQETLDTYDHLNVQPSNGTILRGVSSDKYWRISNGTRTQVPAQAGHVTVDEQTINNFPGV